MLRQRDLVRPPVAGNAENLRMIAPGPDDRPGQVLVDLRIKLVDRREILIAFG